MKRFVIHFTGFFCLIFLFIISGCESEIYLSGQSGGEEISEDKVLVEIFARANSYPLPSTKGAGDENTVGTTPWVLVFKGNDTNATFIEAVQAYEIVGKRYVVLTKQPADNQYQLLVLANPQSRFYYGDAITGYEFKTDNFLTKMTPGATTLSEAGANLLTEPLATPFSTAIPLSYLLTVDKIDSSTRIENSDGSSLSLIRAVAKILVVNKASDFELKGITTIVNMPRQGQLHRLDNTVMDNSSNLTDYLHDAGYSAALATAESVADGQSTENNPVYVYEFDNSGDRYMIIQGTYGNRDYYYKMAIVGSSLQPVSMLRNYAYTFTITSVKGPGYDTVADAKASKASNTSLDFSILVDDSDSYEIIANNDYYLGVSNSVFIVYTDNERDYEAFKMSTDCQTVFPYSNSITDNRDLVEYSFALAYPSDGLIPIKESNASTPQITPVGVTVKDWLKWNEDTQYYEGVRKNNAYVTLKLGNLEKQIFIRHRNAIPIAGATLKYMPTGNTGPDSGEVDYYCLSAYVEDGIDNPVSWIKLRPSTPDSDREDTDYITVDDGIIYIEIQPNNGAERSGIVYLSTIRNPTSSVTDNTVKRIKIHITQLGVTIE